jgi:hypothetical protein
MSGGMSLFAGCAMIERHRCPRADNCNWPASARGVACVVEMRLQLHRGGREGRGGGGDASPVGRGQPTP